MNIMFHSISWCWLAGFFLWMVHNILVLNRKVNLDKKRQIAKQYNAVAKLYPEGTYIPIGIKYKKFFDS